MIYLSYLLYFSLEKFSYVLNVFAVTMCAPTGECSWQDGLPSQAVYQGRLGSLVHTRLLKTPGAPPLIADTRQPSPGEGLFAFCAKNV